MSSPSLPHVLVVEDYDDAREMYAVYLEFAGFRVSQAANGLDAVERAVAERPDAIVMDLALPGIDGWEATRRIKSHPATAGVPVMALTGHVLPVHAAAARDAGCDAFVVKPCTPDVLVDELRRLLGRDDGHSGRGPGGHRTSRRRPGSGRRYRGPGSGRSSRSSDDNTAAPA